MEIGKRIAAAALCGILCGAAAAESSDHEKPLPGLRIGGFSDFNFFATDEEGLDSSSGFDEGQFVLHFVSSLTERIHYFAEVSLTGRDDEFKSEVERTILKFEFSDRYKVSLGRFHTPINWWNTAFHHGQWLQTTVSRPEMTKFGGEFIPVHFVGGFVEGAIPSGAAGLYYEAGVGNGRSENIARAGDDGDVNNNRAWLVRLTSKPDKLYGLQAGAAFHRDKISEQPMIEDFRESITSAFVVWSRETPEVIAEYALIDRNGVGTDRSFESEAYYVQVAYRLPQWKTRAKPYFRFERINVDDADPVFSTQRDREGYLAGVRLDVALLVAVKVEYRHQRTDEDPYVDAVFVQVSFGF